MDERYYSKGRQMFRCTKPPNSTPKTPLPSAHAKVAKEMKTTKKKAKSGHISFDSE